MILAAFFAWQHGVGGPAEASAAVSADFFGLYSEDSYRPAPPLRDVIFRSQLDAGAGLVRQPFDWSMIEPAKDQWHIDESDGFMIAAARAGVPVLPTLVNSPPWASSRPPNSKKHGYYPPARLADMQDYARGLIARYGPDGIFWRAHPELVPQPIRRWQVWNEPNIPSFWPSGPNPAAYTRLLTATANAIHAADPGAQVVSAGLTNSPMGPSLPDFLEGMYAAGAKGHFDVLGVHPYASDAAGTLARLQEARRVMDSHSDSSPMWATEFGWASGGDPSPHTTNEAGQATQLETALRQMVARRASLNLEGAIYYNWQDGEPDTPDASWASQAGLLRSDGTRKPAYYTFRRVSLDLADPTLLPAVPNSLPAPGETANSSSAPPPQPFVRVLGTRVVSVARDGSLRLRVRCMTSAPDSRCAGGIRLERRLAHRRPFVLARRHYELRPAAVSKLRIMLTARGRRMITASRLRLRGVFTGTPADRPVYLIVRRTRRPPRIRTSALRFRWESGSGLPGAAN